MPQNEPMPFEVRHTSRVGGVPWKMRGPCDFEKPNIPRGAKYPIFEVSGPQNHTLNGFWDQRP